MIELLKLYHMAEQFGVTVDGFELNSRESLSLMDEEGSCYIAIDPFKLTSSMDEKEKLGHELGHCITAASIINMLAVTFGKSMRIARINGPFSSRYGEKT